MLVRGWAHDVDADADQSMAMLMLIMEPAVEVADADADVDLDADARCLLIHTLVDLEARGCNLVNADADDEQSRR